MRVRSPWIAAFALSVAISFETAARADVVPAAPELPHVLTLDEALRIFRKQGLDLLMLDAATRAAEGAVKSAGASANPVLTSSVGNAITWTKSDASKKDCLATGAACSPWIYTVGVSDSAALMDFLSGVRGLRLRVALSSLAAAKMNRADAERTLGFNLKAAFVNVAQTSLALKFAREIAASNATTLQKFRVKFKAGQINEGDLQRVETQKLESDQALDSAIQDLRVARVGLAFILGVRGIVPEYEVDEKVLDYSVPSRLAKASEKDLTKLAFEHRPDLVAASFQMDSAKSQIDLTKRMRIPPIAVGINYAWGGFGGFSTNEPGNPQVFTVSVSLPIPVFYQFDGEIAQAQAQYDASALQRAKVTAQIAGDVSTGFAAFVASRRRVERMEGPRRDDGGLLESATGALDVTALQYDKGAASLTDYLDALRTYTATKAEYIGDLATYWTAVYQLEQAVGIELR